MSATEEKVNELLDKVADDVVKGFGPESEPEVPEPEEETPAEDTEELPEAASAEDGDEDAPEDSQDEELSNDADVTEPSAEVEGSEPELLSEDGFVAQGEEGPLLYSGEENGKAVWADADEVFGDSVFKIKAAGEDHKVTFAEMRRGYQRNADYTKGKTELSNMLKQIQPIVGLGHLLRTDENFQTYIHDYISGVKTTDLSQEMQKAAEEGDTDRIKALLKQKTKLDEQKAKVVASEAVQRQQDQLQLQENQRLARTLITDYNNNISSVKGYMKDLGFTEEQIAELEYAPPLVQTVFFHAAQGQPSIRSKPPLDSRKVLRGKRRQLVRRPPKSVQPGKVQPASNSSKDRRSKAKLDKAYKTGSVHDLANYFAEVLPDEFLEER